MEKILNYNKPAGAFEEALPLGNGSLGAMVYGRTDIERISLNHDTLWSGKPGQTLVEGARESYEKAQALTLEGKFYEAQKELERNFTGPWLNSYMYLGNLYIKREGSSGCFESYSRILDLEKSLVTVSYVEDGISFEREYFVSHPDNCVMVKLKSSSPVSYELTGDCVGKSAVTAGAGSLFLSGECPAAISPNYDMRARAVVYDGDGVKVSAIVRVSCDGKTEYKADALLIQNVTDVTIYFCAETSFIDFDKLPTKPTFYPCEKRMTELYQKPYDEIKADHLDDVMPLFNRIETDFGGPTSNLPTDERIRSDQKDTSLCELLYNFGRYLIIASSREGSRATNLQGIWNEHFYAPWSSNYTVNINTEMNYWPVLMCNLPECHQPMIELIKAVSVNGRETAKHYYGAEGFVSHHNLDLWANTTPVGNKVEASPRYAYWNMSSGWLCRHLFEHYEYTLDKDFLASVAYPIMVESAKFYLSVMINYNGKWIITPSTSPENGVIIDGKVIHTTTYTTMTQSIVEDLFTNILASAKILGIEDSLVAEIRKKLPNVGIYKIGSHGELLEYNEEYEEEDVHHRHVSHLYAMYPAGIITTNATPELAHACRQTLEIRGDESTGWSMGWKVNLWARLKDGNRAYKLVKTQLTFVDPSAELKYSHGGGTYANMFDAHPPFQIDGNFGVVAGITQMFLQCEDGRIKILPALPDEMKNGKIKGLLAKGKIKVDIEWKNSKLSRLELVTPIAQTAIINIEGVDREIALEANEIFVIE
ncbi:MAG: glycoside hydrolase N-terminal domain-containing protein [Clostridia bacterium]|nr:glycoside hydrolase N-terminal domain-containing protein [Clostridia bacterium]